MAELNEIMVGKGANDAGTIDPTQTPVMPSVADSVILLDDSDSMKPKVSTMRDIISLAYDVAGDVEYTGAGDSLSNIETVADAVFDITESNKNNLIVMESEEGWTLTLPRIEDIQEDSFRFSVIHKKSDLTKGSIVPHHEDIIEEESLKTVYGRVRIDVIMSDNSWKITNQSSFFDQEGFGKTKKIRFDNTESFEVFHNLSNTPIVQSWVEDEFGEIQEANVSITHDWESENSFFVKFDSPQTGYILYI